MGYFRHFIKNFAKITKPLQDLLGCANSQLKNHPLVLSEQALGAFHTLKEKCATAPVLAYADLKKPFLLEMDASREELGAMLQQVQDDGKYHPVAYASRSLHVSEKNYHLSKLEFLALKWAVTEQFKEYLLYKPFTVKTNKNPLTYILHTPNLDATGHRWVSALADFNMKIEYLPGADNKVADALSRVESCLTEEETKQFINALLDDKQATQDPCQLDEITVKEVIYCARFHHIPRAETNNPLLVAHHEEIENQVIVELATLVATGNIKHNLISTNWKVLQQKDPILQHVIDWKRVYRKMTKQEKDDENHCQPDHQTLEEYLSMTPKRMVIDRRI